MGLPAAFRESREVGGASARNLDYKFQGPIGTVSPRMHRRKGEVQILGAAV